MSRREESLLLMIVVLACVALAAYTIQDRANLILVITLIVIAHFVIKFRLLKKQLSKK